MEGYYYFHDEAPHYNDWHYFGSRNWHRNDGSPEPFFGETAAARQRWRNGSFIVPFPDAMRVGQQGCIDGSENVGAEPLPSLLVLGVDSRCWRTRPVPGFIVADGGAIGNGSAPGSHGALIVATGGAIGGGYAQTSTGGYVEGSGGAIGGGSAGLAHGGTFETSGGGGIGDGSGITSHGGGMVATGGAIGNGAGVGVYVPSTILVAEGTQKVVNNTGAETTLLSSSFNFVSANLAVGSLLHISAAGTIRFQNVASQQVILRFKMGTTTLVSWTLISTNAGPVAWSLTGQVNLTALGSPGSAKGGGNFQCQVGTITVTTMQATQSSPAPTTSGNPALDFTATWSTGATNNNLTLERFDCVLFR